LEGLQDLHEKCQVAHRDIKPSNILFSETRACWVYSDLGIAQPFGKNGLP
jgi:serine/threonine protein kinase